MTSCFRIFGQILVLAAVTFCVGCTGPSYKTNYYTLAADREAGLQTQAPADLSIGMGPVRLPESLDRSGIVSWSGSNQLSVAPYDVWAGDLRDAVTRVVADDLSAYLGTGEVWPFPWDNRVRPDYQLALLVERFGGERGGELELQAKWRILSNDGQRVLESDQVRFTATARNSSYESYVETLNGLLHELAKHLSGALVEAVAEDGGAS